MYIYRNTDHLPAFRRAVITIGTFDGVHTGHQQILQQLRQAAARIDGETVIITFHPHPRKIVRGDAAGLRLINTLQEKTELLAAQGIDNLVVVPFTEAFSQLTAEQYITDFLVGRFHPHTIIIGYDHQFGQGRKGDYHLLEDFSARQGFGLQEIPVHLLNEVSVSSTRIREAIVHADIATANRLLGYPFFFDGLVVEGNKLGRTIGYPTANLQVGDEEKLIPGNGVYAVEIAEAPVVREDITSIEADGRQVSVTPGDAPSGERPLRWKAMMNIGVRPTVDGTRRTIEANLFDFDGDLYGKKLRVFVRQHLRGEQKFAGLDALKEQLARDRAHAFAALG